MRHRPRFFYVSDHDKTVRRAAVDAHGFLCPDGLRHCVGFNYSIEKEHKDMVISLITSSQEKGDHVYDRDTSTRFHRASSNKG